MTKKIEPTEAYLQTLIGDLDLAKSRFEIAKKQLYQHTATAKLGEPPFEKARKDCLDAVRDIEKIENEISTVRAYLRK